ncbi:FAD-binding oxidoreductase [Bradyrhizobium sp. SRL28]|nr:FAD-binding oxidoreductase [Bradyrhizobium sp. SRL28]
MRKQRTDDGLPADAESKCVAGDDRGQVFVLQLPDHSGWWPVHRDPSLPHRALTLINRFLRLEIKRQIQPLGGARGVQTKIAAPGFAEFEAGRLSAVVTESGTIKTKVAVLAGGAWASSFCRQVGIRFPQASIRSSILAVSPGAQDLPDVLHTASISLTRRSDGGYTLAISGRGRVDVTPQQLRFAPQFLPMFLKRWRSLLPGGFEGIRSGHERLKRWKLDEPTPMEHMRILDPTPDPAAVKLTHSRAIELIPELRKTKITAAWAGYIDSTPDGVPGIGELEKAPGLILAAGFSGHGFGIGPGAGHLIADLVTGAEPIFDPKPYRPDRFSASAWGKVADF